MEHETISPTGFDVGRQRRRQTASRRRFLLLALGLSVAVHLAAALVVVLVPRVLPSEPRPPVEGTVELLMVEQKGARPSAAPQHTETQHTETQPAETQPAKTQPTPPEPEKPPEAPKQQAQKPGTQNSAAVPVPPVVEDAKQPAPPPAEEKPRQTAKAAAKPDARQAAPPPAPPKAQEAPVFDLAGTESESNAYVLGGRVLPASPDNRFRNRPPIYPLEAEARGEHGAVVVLIHVSEAGVATGVDVVESSGVGSLDQAAVAAVRKWRFHPALQAGRPVPFDMPFRFVFEEN